MEVPELQSHHQRQFLIPKEISEISATVKDLKYVHEVILSKTQFNSPTGLVQKPGGLGE